MSHSEHEGFVRGFEAFATSDATVRAFDTAVARDVFVNNACHLADEVAQVRVNWSMATFSPSGTVVDTWYLVHVARFPLTVIDSRTCPLVVELRIAASQAATVAWRAVLNPGGSTPVLPLSTDAMNIGTATSTTSTQTWTHLSKHLVMGPELIAAARSRVPYLRSDAGDGGPSHVPVVLAQLEVWAKTANAAATASLGGLCAREYVGL